ncbi:alpha/beta hydrolase [Terricaulis silvestris]|uniref:Alpha/beta hydrolase fold protein n=1 Tax=Terricaulis silvestris TaxID=2686094 RepID=A0A6I6MP37_9CAUL|nr:alpha/beta hydrolase [Terricaulis silvestris]QGZ93312.1 alpha/beta hydrolase fold protein [Terricaulis silvestris]
MSLDLEKQYNNRARVPDSAAIIASWARDAAAYREIKPPRMIAYGDGERHSIDLFEAGEGPVVMYIHGGYWQALDKSFHSIHARGLNQLGITVAVPSYDLCPAVAIGDIIRQLRHACISLHEAVRAPIIASGHSAGGHLAVCMLASEDYVPAAYSISGLFELSPLIETSLNEKLQLTPERATAYSPIFWPAPEGKTLDAVVGADESSEFLRQSAAIVTAWGEDGVNTRYEEIDGANHFTVIAPLVDPSSAMCERLKQLVDAAR